MLVQFSSTTKYVSGDNFGGNQTSSNFVDGLMYTYTIEPVSVADNTMNMLRITYTDGSQDPILYANWRAHPKINSTASSEYGQANRPYSSSDYVGAFRIAMEEKGYRTSFYQGTAGNMNAHSNIDSETNSKTKGDKGQQGGLYGKYLAQYALTAMSKTTFETVTGGEIVVKDQPFIGGDTVYPYSVVKAAQLWKEAYDAGNAKYNYDYNGFKFNSYYHANAVYGRTKGSTTDVTFKGTSMVLNAITIGDNLALLNTANELYDRYSDTGSFTDNDWNDLDSLGYGKPFVMGYTNSSKGYLPNTMAYDYNASSSTYGKGSYEANTTGYAQGDGERMVKAFAGLLGSMKNTNATIEAHCEACDQVVTWTALHGIYDDTAIDSGHYYLSEDAAASMNFQKQINGKVCLLLNGYTYANQSTTTGRAFVVNNGATLSIMGQGKVQGQGHSDTIIGGVIAVNKGGTLNLYDATIERVRTEQHARYGGTVHVSNGGTFNMHSGTVTGGWAEGTTGYTGCGGNVYADGTFNMYGGTVTGGKAEQNGQNVFITENGTFAMSGGTITGGVHVKAANKNVSLSGKAVIYDGDTATKDLFLDNDGSNELKSCALTAGAKIGITAVRHLANEAYFDYFVADTGTYLTKLNGKVFAGDRYQCECGGKAVGKYGHTCNPIVWAPWPGSKTPPPFGNYYLKYNLTGFTSAINVTGTLHLDLNGKNMIRSVSAASGSSVFVVDGANELLTITDSSAAGSGTISRDVTDETVVANHTGIIVNVTGSNATFRFYDGIMDAKGQATTSGGGGAVAGNNNDATPRIEIYGGTLKGASANYGGGIYAKGPVLLAGGTITGGVASKSSGGVHIDTKGSLILAGDASVTGNTLSVGTESNIYCPAGKLTVAGTYTGTAGISVSNPSMGKVIGISDKADITNATLTVDGDDLYEIVTSGTQLKLTASSNMVVKQTNGSDVAYYESMEEALGDYAGGDAVLTLLQDVSAITLTAPTKIDLAGHDIGAVTLNGGSLEVMDSATDDFTVEDANGYGTVPKSVSVTVTEGYIRIVEDGVASFHRLDLSMSKLSLRPSNAGLYYGSRFGGDEVIKAHMTEYGVALRANTAPDVTYIQDDADKKFHWGYAASQWVVNGGENEKNGVILNGVLKPENGYTINKRNAEVPVYGVSYVILDGQMILGDTANYTMHQFFEIFDNGYYTGQNAVRTMYETYEQVMRTWNIPNIKASSFAGKTAVFVGDSITYGAKVENGEQWWNHVKQALKLGSVQNMGVSGSCITDNNDRAHNYQPLTDRYQNIPGADLIFIFMGTNDFGHNTMITTEDYNSTYHADKTRTLAVDLNMMIDYLQEKYPESEIVLITPIARHTATKNKIGRTLQDYVDAVKAVGAAQGIPVADIYDTTIAQMPLETYFDADNVHPNAQGHVVLAEIITDWLKANKGSILG